MQYQHQHRVLRLLGPAILTVCLLFDSQLPGQGLPPGVPEIRIEPPIRERVTVTGVDTRKLLREAAWDLPIYLVTCDMPETTMPPSILKQALDWDQRYFEHLGLKRQAAGATLATKPVAQIDAVKTPYTLGTLKVETRQSVWVWSLWIPFGENFKKSEAPKNVNQLIPALQDRMVYFDHVGKKIIYLSESAHEDSDLRIVNTMKTETGVLLWGMKGNWKTSGTPISSQMDLNQSWFRSAESTIK